MPDSGPFGSVRGVSGNGYPYRDVASTRCPLLGRLETPTFPTRTAAAQLTPAIEA